jgi:hypothetical protein
MDLKKLISILLLSLLFYTCNSFADAVKQDWYGIYAMNHDGWKGELKISEIKADCAGPIWCDMALSYKNHKGESISGEITKIDDKNQHMTFYLNFPNNKQKFDAYIFSWDKKSIAGTTYWGGRTFGFYAIK